jgi:hypothetical protein
MDPDGDSLSFAFAPAYISAGTSATYIAPYTPATPMPWTGAVPNPFPGGIRCDAVTGDIKFTPPNTGSSTFTGVIVIEVKKWRTLNGVPTVVGIVRRDMQMSILDCPPNTPPAFVTYPPNPVIPNQPKTIYSVCANSTLCFTVAARDPDRNPGVSPPVSDTTYIRLLNTIDLGATLTPLYTDSMRQMNGPRQDSMRFCWTPGTNRVRNAPWIFSLNAKDKRCPNVGKSTTSFAITVLPGPFATISKSNSCGAPTVSFTKQSYTGTGYRWDISNTPGAFNDSDYSSYINTSPGSLNFTDTGSFVIRLSLTGDTSCTGPQPLVTYDTIVITKLIRPIPDTTICPGTAVKFRMATAGLSGPLQYKWKKGNTVLSIHDSLIHQAFEMDTLVAVVADTNNCTLTDTFVVHMLPGLSSTLPSGITGCAGSQVVLNPGTGASNKYVWSTGDSSPTITRSTAGTYWVTISDTGACSFTDTVTLTFATLPAVYAGNDMGICAGNSVHLAGTGNAAGYRWMLPPSTLLSVKDTVTVKPSSTSWYVLEGTTVTNGTACTVTDSIKVVVHAKPVLTMPAIKRVCLSSVTLQLATPGSTKPGAGVWSYMANSAAVTSTGLVTIALLGVQPTAANSYTADNVLTYHFTDTNGCTAVDSAGVRLHTVPQAEAGTSRAVCANDGVINLATQLPSPAGGVWSGPGVTKPGSPFVFTPASVGAGACTLKYMYSQLFSGIITCSSVDSTMFTVNPKPTTGTISGSIAPQRNTQETYSVTNTSGSTYNWFVAGGTQSSGGTTSAIAVQWAGTGPGLVAVRETNAGCPADTVKLSVTIGNTGIDGIAGIKGLSVYPNPTDGRLFVALASASGEISIAVTDPLGRVVMRSDEAHAAGDYLKAIDLSQMSAGVYVVSIISGQQVASVKVTVTGN